MIMEYVNVLKELYQLQHQLIDKPNPFAIVLDEDDILLIDVAL
jgi:hypothetical protein